MDDREPRLQELGRHLRLLDLLGRTAPLRALSFDETGRLITTWAADDTTATAIPGHYRRLGLAAAQDAAPRRRRD